MCPPFFVSGTPFGAPGGPWRGPGGPQISQNRVSCFDYLQCPKKRLNKAQSWLNITGHIQGDMLKPFRPRESSIGGYQKHPKMDNLDLTMAISSGPTWLNRAVNLCNRAGHIQKGCMRKWVWVHGSGRICKILISIEFIVSIRIWHMEHL